MRRHCCQRTQIDGFSLVEVLTVIALIAVLAGILIPTVTAVRVAASKTQTRIQFSQWAAAITAFRSEYGYYPVFHDSGTVNGGADETDHAFHDVLAARKRDGSTLSPTSAAAMQNKKRISFYSFSEKEFTRSDSLVPNLLQDGSGATEIAVLVDRNLDGVVDTNDYGPSLPLVNGIRPLTTDIPATGIRAGVIFYCAAPGATVAAPQFIFSWKSS
jgi:prepilin-type N-terminal cleavage/methylation domain-containing protein